MLNCFTHGLISSISRISAKRFNGRRFLTGRQSLCLSARKRFVDSIARHAPNRSVVITGDNHANWVNDIRAPVPNGKVVTTEFVGTSISSGGNGAEHATYIPEAACAENPNVKWQNSRRGYVVCEVAPDTFRAQFRTVDYVDKRGAPLNTPTSWRLERGRAGVIRE